MSVSTVRLLTGDIPQRGRFEATGDGLTTEYDIPEHPLLTAPRVTVDGVLQTDTVDYTVDLALGVLTFDHAPSTDEAIIVTYSWAQFSDGDLQAFLDVESGNVRLAAADVLDSIATSAALLQGRITMLDLTLDGAAVAKILADQAKSLRDFATSGDAPVPVAGPDDVGFAIAEMVWPTNAQEKLQAEVLRNGW